MEDAPLPNEYSKSLKSDKNNTYKIKFIGVDNYLLIQSLKDLTNNIIHETKVLLNDIKSNKYFSICDSIYDVLYSLKPNLINKVTLEELNDELKLTIPLNHPLAKEISFNLKKIKNSNSNSNEQQIQKLFNLINTLTQKVENQQKEINSLKKRVNDLENINKKQAQNNKIEDKPKKNEYNNINNNSNYKFVGGYTNKPIPYYFSKTEYSYIMKNENEELSIKNWIHGNNHMKFKLLFRMSRDGTTSINFHTKCDSSGKTLILIETKEGKRIGGYTSLQWNMDGEKKYGENVWLFNLEGTIWKYPLMKQNRLGAIICDMNNGPSFDEGIIFKNNDLSVAYIECQALYKNAGFTDNKIYIKELEVFQVNIKYK